MFTTRDDAIDQIILPTLTIDGEDAIDQFDVDAIADEVLAYHDGWDETRQVYNLTNTGFYQCVTDDEFWSIVERHAL